MVFAIEPVPSLVDSFIMMVISTFPRKRIIVYLLKVAFVVVRTSLIVLYFISFLVIISMKLMVLIVKIASVVKIALSWSRHRISTNTFILLDKDYSIIKFSLIHSSYSFFCLFRFFKQNKPLTFWFSSPIRLLIYY